MSADDELWAYDEPHESDGNCHVTMTRRQAIEWFRSLYPLGATDDESLFSQWTSLHFAYKVEPALPVAAVRDALELYDSALSEAEAILGGEYGDYHAHLMEAVDKARTMRAALGLGAVGGKR